MKKCHDCGEDMSPTAIKHSKLKSAKEHRGRCCSCTNDYIAMLFHIESDKKKKKKGKK